VLQRNKNFYSKSIEQFGVSPQGVHWKDKYTQHRRFDILTGFIKDEIKNSTIIDAGCGFGDYYLYLEKNNLLPKNYMGIDCEEQMITLAKEHCKKPFFYLKNILEDQLPKTDYYMASGTLNILNIQEVELFIKKVYEHSNKGFIFNCLKGLTFNKIDKIEIISICRNYCESSQITIREGYLNNDFTVFMGKSL